MFLITVQHEFAAAHAIVLRGEREPIHGHNWRVEAVVGAESLDEDGLVADFHALQAALDAILHPFMNRNLNEVSPFDTINPSAEHVARHVGDALAARLSGIDTGTGARVVEVRVSEAPGCIAAYRP